MQPEPGILATGRSTIPYLVLLQEGFTYDTCLRKYPVVSYSTISPLPRKSEAVYFLWHFPSPGVLSEVSRINGTPCPMKSGLSSPYQKIWRGCLLTSPTIIYTLLEEIPKNKLQITNKFQIQISNRTQS